MPKTEKRIRERKSYLRFERILNAFRISEVEGLRRVHQELDDMSAYRTSTIAVAAEEALDLLLSEYKEDTSIAPSMEWWYSMPMQNLVDPNHSWAGYCQKHFPNEKHCGDLNHSQINYIFEQETL